MAGFLFFVLGAAVVGGWWMWRFTSERDLRAQAARTLGLPESPPAATFIGEYADLIVPRNPRRTAQLDLFDWGVRLRGLQSRWDPVWEIRYGELAYAQFIRSAVLPVTGVLLNPAPGVPARPMIFWTGLHDDLLRRLRQQGVPADHPAATLEWTRRFLAAHVRARFPWGGSSIGYSPEPVKAGAVAPEPPAGEAAMAAPRKPYLYALLVLPFAAAAAVFLWQVVGANSFAQPTLPVLRSDLRLVHLPAGYRLRLTSESRRGCGSQVCTVKQFWIWRGTGARTPAAACRDVSRAMAPSMSVMNDQRVRGAACFYSAVLDSFFHPSAGKRSFEAYVWVTGRGRASPGGFDVELLDSYDLVDY
ncbi:MAG: hypothetical protein ACM32E_17960 [Gemmatimonadota bacterium]